MSALKDIIRTALWNEGVSSFDELVQMNKDLAITQRALSHNYKDENKTTLGKICDDLQGDINKEESKLRRAITENIGDIILRMMWEQEAELEEEREKQEKIEK